MHMYSYDRRTRIPLVTVNFSFCCVYVHVMFVYDGAQRKCMCVCVCAIILEPLCTCARMRRRLCSLCVYFCIYDGMSVCLELFVVWLYQLIVCVCVCT